MPRKKTDAVKLGENLAQIVNLFRRADRKKLEAAIDAKDFGKVAKAMGVTEKELKGLYKKGGELSTRVLGNPFKETVKVFSKSIRK